MYQNNTTQSLLYNFLFSSMKTLFAFIGASFVLFMFFFSCQRIEPQNRHSQFIVDSLYDSGGDSIDVNPFFSREQWNKAINMAIDSPKYYQIYSALASSYMRTGDYDTAKRMALRVLHFCNNQPVDSFSHSLLADAYNFLGVYHSVARNFDSSIIFYKNAIAHIRYSSKVNEIPNIYINMADLHTQKGDYVNCVYYYQKALAVSDSLHIAGQFNFPINFGLGQAYFGIGDYDLSDKYFRLAEEQLESRTLSEKFTFCNNRGNYYYYKGEYTNALPWFRKARALVLPGNYKFHIGICETNLGDIFCKLNQLDSAHHYLSNSYGYFKSINHNVFLYYIATVSAELALKQGDVDKARQWVRQYSNIAGVDPQYVVLRNKLLQQYFYKVANYKQAYDYLQQNVRIDDSISSEHVKSRVAELDMRYKQDTSLLRKNILIQEQKSDLEYFRLAKYFWLSVFFVFVVVAVFVFLYHRKKNDLLRLQHLNQISKLRMESVRNRVSPHFIFNVLNHEIISERNDSERSELRGVVKLLRHSLEITEKLCVPLAKELDFVKTYIEIERESLGNDFFLRWEVDESVDIDTFLLPSMIVQIPVENAIKHALRGKSGLKELRVSVLRKDGGVAIAITDNGMGYAKVPVSQKGTGTGLRVIRQTVELLNARNNEKIDFTISTLNGLEGGTRVAVYIPFNYSYEM